MKPCGYCIGVMARGWESKSVEAQQESREAGRPAAPALTPEQAKAARRRERITLELARAEADLARATSPAHRRMLTAAVAALRRQLQ